MHETREDYAVVTAIVTAVVVGAVLNGLGLSLPALTVLAVGVGVFAAIVYYYSGL